MRGTCVRGSPSLHFAEDNRALRIDYECRCGFFPDCFSCLFSCVYDDRINWMEREGKSGRKYELTGHFSFDFIIEERENEIYVLESNVVSVKVSF